MSLSSVSDEARVGIIVGVTLLAVVLVIILIILVIMCYRRNTHASHNEQTLYVYSDSSTAHYSTKNIIKNSQKSKNNKQVTDDNRKLEESNNNTAAQQSNMYTVTPQLANNTVTMNTTNHITEHANPSYAAADDVTSRPRLSSLPRNDEGIENPAFYDGTQPGIIDRQSSHLQRRWNRMDSNTAAVIAAEKDRTISVFSVSDTETDEDSVIVFEQRTAV